MRGTESVKFANIAATTAPFTLTGGHYAFSAHATGAGTISLEKLGPDGTTYTAPAAATTFTAVDGYGTVFLPPGMYRVSIVTFTAVYADITRIPYE